VIPDGSVLVEDSIRSSAGTFTIGGTTAGSVISWQVGDVAVNSSGQVGYTVQRVVPPTPAVPLALEVNISAPATANRNEEFDYEFTVINRAPIALTDLVLTNTIPNGASYVAGSDSAPNAGVVQWTIPVLAAESSTTRTYTVRAVSSMVNHDYRVVSNEGASARGRILAVTEVDGQPPLAGDGFVLVNRGATAAWGVQGQGGASNPVSNPSYLLYLPAVAR
jgi:uncharacterized repeat protein (TIGR01451 family)